MNIQFSAFNKEDNEVYGDAVAKRLLYRESIGEPIPDKWVITQLGLAWVSISEQKMPLEKYLIVSHAHGVEAIHFHSARWCYWYSGDPVAVECLNGITHWCEPQKTSI